MLQVEQLGFQSIQQVAERCNTGCYPDRHRSVFEQYIKTSNLSDGEYLFCAANASVRPLSSDALRKICVLWARKANIDAGPLTPHSVRKTTDDYADDAQNQREDGAPLSKHVIGIRSRIADKQ